MRVWLLSGGGFKGAVQLPVLDMLRARDGLPDVILGTSVGSINGAMAAQDALPELARIWADVDDPHAIDGIRGFLSPAVLRGRGLFSLRPLQEQLDEHVAPDRLRVRFGCGAVVRESGEYLQPEWGPGAAKHPLRLDDGIAASCAIAGIMEPVRGASGLLSDGGHRHVFPKVVGPLAGVTIDAIGCSPVAHQPQRQTRVDGLLEALVWAAEQAMHAAYLGDIERLYGYARAGASVRLYAPNRSTGGMLDADRDTIADRLEMGRWMAAHPEVLS